MSNLLPGSERSKGITTIWVPAVNFGPFRIIGVISTILFVVCLRATRRYEADYIYTSTAHLHGIIGFIASKVFHSRLIVDYGDPWWSRIGWLSGKILGFLERIVLRSAKTSKVICSDEICYSRIARFYMCRPHLLPMGVDKELIINSNSKIPELSKALGRNEHVILLYLGYLGKPYRIDLMINAFMILRQKGADVKLVLAGDGPLKSWLIEVTRHESSISFLGQVDRETAFALIRLSDICLNACEDTCWGTKVIEYQYMGKPTVVACGWFNEDYGAFLKHEVNCLLTPLDAHAFADAIMKLLLNKDLSRSISSNARRTACLLEWDLMVDRLIKMLGV